MKHTIALILSAIVLLSGCAFMTSNEALEESKESTGLGTNSFSTGGSFTASNANAIVRAVDHIYSLNGVIRCDGSSECYVVMQYESNCLDNNSGICIDIESNLIYYWDSDDASMNLLGDSDHIHIEYQAELDVPTEAQVQDRTSTTEYVLTPQAIGQAIVGYGQDKFGWEGCVDSEPDNEWVGQQVWVCGYDAGYDPLDLANESPSYTGPYEVKVTSAGTPWTIKEWARIVGNDVQLSFKSLNTLNVIESISTDTNLDDGDCGKIFLATAALELGYPNCDPDLVGCEIGVHVRDASEQVVVKPYRDAANDQIVLKDGTALTAGYSADLPATATDDNKRYKFACLEDNKWYTTYEDGTVQSSGGGAGTCGGATYGTDSTTLINNAAVANRCYAARVTVDCSDTAGHLYAQIKDWNSSNQRVILALYDDDGTGGEPSTRLAQATVSGSGSVITRVEEAYTASISAGNYWVAMCFESTSNNYGYASVSGGTGRYYTPASFEAPSPWPHASDTNSAWDRSVGLSQD